MLWPPKKHCFDVIQDLKRRSYDVPNEGTLLLYWNLFALGPARAHAALLVRNAIPTRQNIKWTVRVPIDREEEEFFSINNFADLYDKLLELHMVNVAAQILIGD